MKKRLRGTIAGIEKSLVIHPVLLAVFPLLFLYAGNIDQTTVQQALSPLWYAVPGTLILWLLFYLWMRNIFKAGLAASLLVLLFFFYGHFYVLLDRWGVAPGHGILLPLMLLICGYLIYFISRARRDFRTTTRVLNVIAAVVILMNIFNITSYQLGRPDETAEEAASEPQASAARVTSSETSPDIYLIVLDEYGNPDIMKETYGYDDSELLNNLQSQGFYVAKDSRTHSNETIRVLASVLNMEYTSDTESTEVTYQRIENNAVVNFLRSKGYQYVYFGQWYEEQRYQVPADVYYNFYEAAEKGTVTPEYSAALWNTTALTPFYNYLFGGQYEGYYRDGLLNTLNQLEKVPEISGPKFVFAHILCPHTPFIFGPNGEPVASNNYYNFDDKQYYLGQYIFISRKIDAVIQKILDTSAAEPIIILQSDHGPRWMDENDWKKILNTYHLPGDDESLLYENISPVNSFRLIFDHYFQADYKMLEDK
jgi:hypothetical protein